MVRLKKADSIRRMLADQSSGPLNSLGDSGSSMDADVRQQLDEEKRQREHLLALNQVIAQQVLEKSRMVAGKSLDGAFVESPTSLLDFMLFFSGRKSLQS